MFAVGVDIGGTKIAAGVVDEHGEILAKVKRPTEPQRPASIDEAIADAVLELAREYEVAAVGLAAAGFVSSDRATVTFAPNIAWRDYPLAANVKNLIQLDVPVVVENDANAAGWAEFVHGAGRDARSMVLLTVGTGLGGAIVRTAPSYAARTALPRKSVIFASSPMATRAVAVTMGVGSSTHRARRSCARHAMPPFSTPHGPSASCKRQEARSPRSRAPS
jgi:hypothetical protein